MAQKLKFGNGTWATKEGSTLAYNDENNNYKPLPFTTTRNSIGTRVNKEGLIEVVGNDIPRIDYTDDSKGALLLEPQRTNSFPYSSDFTSFASASNGTGTNPVITSNYSVSPDGTQNADRIQFNRGSGTSSSDTSYVTYGLSLGTIDATLSIYLKTNDGTTKDVTLRLGASLFDYDVTITSNWQRFTLSGNTSVDRLQILLYGNQNSQTADISCFGAQVEQNSFSTSYIPTSGSSVTRQADTASGSGNSEVFNDSEGSLYMDFDVIEKTSSSYYIVSVRSSNGSNVLGVGGRQGKAFAEMFDGTNYISNNSANLVDGKNKIFLTYNSGSSAKLFLNGIKVLDFTGTIPTLSNLSELTQGDRFLGNKYYGNISEIGYYDAVLTDSELEYLTSYRSLNELVTELNLNTL